MAEPASAIDLETVALAKLLIACRSITPDDGGSLDIVASRLSSVGFRCERLDRARVRNLWARWGMERPILCFAGHVDVVPPGPAALWSSDPFVPTERQGRLYGRGAADMKTSVAAMVTAVERYAASPPQRPGSLGVLLTSDEEGEATHGTTAVVEELRRRGEMIDGCIIGEPTSESRLGDTIKNGRRGSLNGALKVKGTQRHIAYPERGANPIHAGWPALAELIAREWDAGSDYFQPTSFQISSVHAGTGATNVTPATLEVLFNLRFSPTSTESRLKEQIHEVLDHHQLDYELAWTLSGQPFLTPRGRLVNALEASIRQTTGLTPALSTSGGTSDGRFLAALAREVIEFGPGSGSIHKADESVGLDEIGALSRIYEAVIRRWLAEFQ
jgi:succinyl-diaminopimelate desuccinylase